jgi:probable O-glycosylation ligase (exosortase A-associated)
MRDLFVTAVVAGVLPFALFNPFVGVVLWTWLSVMNPHRLTWGFAYELPFAQAAAIVTLLSLVIAHRSVRFPVRPVTVVLIAFLVWMNVTMLFAIHFHESIEMWSRVTKTLLMTLVALAVVRTEKQIWIFLWVLVMSVAFFGIKGGIFTILTGAEHRVYGPPNSHIDDNNSISIALLMMIPLMAFLLHYCRQWWLKVGMLGAILLCAVSVVASYSRGAFVAGCAMLTLLALKSRQRVTFLVLMALSIPVIVTAMPQKWWDRMATIFAENPDLSVQGRFNAWAMTWNLALDRPVFGGGFAIYDLATFGRYAPIPDDVHSAHSNYFQVLGEHGFVGLALFLLLALLMWRTGSRVIRASRTDDTRWRADLARALQVGMVGFMVGGLTVNIAYWDVYYFMLVLLVALENLARAADRIPAVVTAAPAVALPSGRT